MSMLLDTHYHFDFIPSEPQRRDFLATLVDQHIGVVAQGILPSADRLFKWQNLECSSGVLRRSAGFHPWQITDRAQAEAELAIFSSELEKTRFVGEIGLDFSPRRLELAERSLQLAVFERILKLVAGRAERIGDANQPVILSIHAVQSASVVLAMLEAIGAPRRDIAPIIHRFSGTSDELTSLIRLGGYISIQPRMLKSKRGRAYVRQIPAERLLLETDFPESGLSESVSGKMLAETVAKTLRETINQLGALRGVPVDAIIEATQIALYGGN